VLRKIWVKGLRNLKEFNLDLERITHLHVLGKNNQGKTNFLESLYILGNGSSPITSKPEYVVNFDNDYAIVGGEIVLGDQKHHIYVKIFSNGKRDILINQKLVKTYSSLKKYLNIDFLSADILHTYTTTSEFRRKDFDKFATSYSHEYKSVLKNYERVIKQKNKALKKDGGDDYISVLNEQLIDLSYDLVKKRVSILRDINGVLFDLLKPFKNLSVKSLDIVYIKKSFEFTDVNDYKNVLKGKLNSSMFKEKAIGYSLYGPHRDDYDILINNKSVFHFYSRGINRIVSVLIKVAQLKLIKGIFNTFPMLLLDDTFAELDLENKKVLMSILEHNTSIVYTTVVNEDSTLFSCGKQFLMKNGELIHG